MSPKAHYSRPCMIMSVHASQLCNECRTLVSLVCGFVSGKAAAMRVWAQGIHGESFPPQFCCEPLTALKISMHFQKCINSNFHGNIWSYLFQNSWKNYKYPHHKEMIHIWGAIFANYPNFIMIQCIHLSNHHIASHTYVKLCVNRNWNWKKSFIMIRLNEDSQS